MQAQEASLFESSEMVAAFVSSSPLLSHSWNLCKTHNTLAPGVFSINRIGDAAYVAFSGLASDSDTDINTMMMMVELECCNAATATGGGRTLFSALRGQEPPAAVHAVFFHLFMSMFHYTDFQTQMIQVMKESKSVILTGHSIGGAIASLSSLWLLSNLQSYDNYNSRGVPVLANHVMCITFGSPMLGNESLCRAILQNRWGGHFCHVVANHDIVPRLLLLDRAPQLLHSLVQQYRQVTAQLPNLENSNYRFFLFALSCLESAAQGAMQGSCSFWPFGSFLFCMNTGAICVDNAKAVAKLIHLMLATASANSCIQDHFMYEYHVGRLNLNGFLKSDDEAFGEGVIPHSSYDVGLALALQSSHLTSTHQESVSREAVDCLRMAKRMARTPNLNSANLAITLSKITPLRAQIEWYKASCDDSGDQLGYYDTFKLRGASKRDAKVNMNRIKLSLFWDDVIQMLDSNQLPHDFHKRSKWVNASHFYKLLVEPLDIAEYYRIGKHRSKGHYLKHGRERRFKVFDRWWKNRGREDENKRSRFASLTQDSCFWARVEEARDWVEKIKVETDVRNLSLLWENINNFENYARNITENKEISKDVLLGNSTYSALMKELSELKQSPRFPAFIQGRVVP